MTEESMQSPMHEADAARAKAEFLATISHEIRTPLNGIIGMSGILLDTELTLEQQECAETIRSSAAALLRIVNDILDFSRIERGRVSTERAIFEPRALVEELIELAYSRGLSPNVQVGYVAARTLPNQVAGDADRTRQIISNLLDNALKFTNNGHVYIRMGATSTPDPDVVLMRVTVHDTGIGIPEDKRALLFMPFSQLDATSTRRFGGVGLGLAICKRLVGSMGGEMGVESAPGRGSTFWFTLPMGTVEPAPDRLQDGIARLGDAPALIVDPNEHSARLVLERLEVLGVSPLWVQDVAGAEGVARRLAQSGRRPRLQFVSASAEGEEGRATVRGLLDSPLVGRVPLLMYGTGSSRAGDEVARSLGAVGFLAKPFRERSLRRRVGLVLGLGSSTDRSARRIAPTQKLTAVRLGADVSTATRVLVAEDNPVNQLVATRMLERIGCRVDVASDGREAVACAQSVAYAIILMDCQMPEVDGYEATKALRAIEGVNRRTPIVAMTANVMPGDRERCLEAGMDDYLPKPLKSEDIARVIQRWIPDVVLQPTSR